MRSVLALIVFLVVTYAVAGLGSVIVKPSLGVWYAELHKPAWTPPGWLFGPVWTLLYTMMGVAAWLVWKRADVVTVTLPLLLYGIQLALNGAWSPVFFGFHQLGWALVIIATLWVAIVATLCVFWRVSPVAGALLLPYLAWVSFASALNFALWQFNCDAP